MEYYVYIHRRKTNGQVFYVGKGCRNRAWSRNRSKHWHRVVNKSGLIVEIVHKGLQEWYAYELEKDLILEYGKLRDNTGHLINISDGGQGRPEGAEEQGKRKPKTKEHRQKLREATIRYYNLHGPHHKGPTSEATKLKMSAAKAGKKLEGENPFAKKVRCKETGEFFPSLTSAIIWLKSIGYQKANSSNLGLALRGIFKQYHGYSWEYVKDEE